MVGDITIDHLRMSIDTVMMADVHQLFLLQEHEKFQYFIMRCVKTQINFSVKIDYHPKAIISTTTKLSKFTVLYTATMKGGKQWLRTVTPPPNPMKASLPSVQTTHTDNKNNHNNDNLMSEMGCR